MTMAEMCAEGPGMMKAAADLWRNLAVFTELLPVTFYDPRECSVEV